MYFLKENGPIPSCIVMLSLVPALQAIAAYAKVATINPHTWLSCSVTVSPPEQSQLVVLLDRSGSLIQQTGATDPERYSTNLTKALVDLWPGMMAVIALGDKATPILGPADLFNPTQRRFKEQRGVLNLELVDIEFK